MLDFTAGLDQEVFVAEQRTYYATLHNLALMGEAAINIPGRIRKEHPEVPWSSVIAMRNRILHAYLGVDNEIVWVVIQDDVPALLSKLRPLVRAGG